MPPCFVTDPFKLQWLIAADCLKSSAVPPPSVNFESIGIRRRHLRKARSASMTEDLHQPVKQRLTYMLDDPPMVKVQRWGKRQHS